MSSASISVFRITFARSSRRAGAAAASANASGCGCVSCTRRCSVQSPPRITFVGTPGSGMIEPNSPSPPANSNDVT